jgi:hypothetical protein
VTARLQGLGERTTSTGRYAQNRGIDGGEDRALVVARGLGVAEQFLIALEHVARW